MAPRASCGSKSESRSKLNRLALIDPSTLRRSSRLTPSLIGAKELERLGGGVSKQRKRKSNCLALWDPNTARRSPRLSQIGNGFGELSHRVDFRTSSRYRASGNGVRTNQSPVDRSGSGGRKSVSGCASKFSAADLNMETGRKRNVETEAAAPPAKGKRNSGCSFSFFMGDPVPEEEAKRRWPWRYEQKERQCRNRRLESDENEDTLVLNVRCHFLQAEVDNCVFKLGDYAHVKGISGGENYVGKILEFFKTNDNQDYFRVQWLFRAEDTVMGDAAESHERKRVFYSKLMNDNLLDCLVSKLKIVHRKPNASLKAKSIRSCDFYYDMEYSLDYSTFCTMTNPNDFVDNYFCPPVERMAFHSNGFIPRIEDKFDKLYKTELTLLDVYAGCGAMSTGLCLGAKLSGVLLETKWAVDINKSACETLKLNHSGTQIRNESAEDFLDLLKEWDGLCKKYAIGSQGDVIKSNTKGLRGAEKSILSGTRDKVQSGEYEVASIVDICYRGTHHDGKRGLKFKVRWVGYGPSEDTWEPIEGLRNCQDAIKDFVQEGCMSKILPRPGDVDVICGGPPCQGISGYNRHRNVASPMDDERNHQIVVFMDLVKFLRPKYVFMENVVDILRFAGGTLGRYALSRLVQMNYQARLGIMAAGCYGLAQFRLRVFLWGANPCECLPQFPLPTHDVVLRYGAPTEFERNVVAYDEGQSRKLEKALVLADAISDLPPISNSEAREEMPYSKPPETEFQKYIRATKSEMIGFAPHAAERARKAMLNDHRAFPLSPDDYLRVCLIPRRKGANFRDLPGVTVDGNKVVRRDPTTEQKLPSGKALVPDYAINLNKGKSMRPFARLWWDETVPTVLCKPDSHIQAVLHPEDDRVLSLRECARLQGFPDYYRFCGSLKARYSQVGNAVAVPVARALGYALGIAVQNKSDPNQPLVMLPSNFSHSTTSELLLQSSKLI